MSQKTESQKDKLNRLFKEYGLLSEDVHKHQHYTIIRRTGIEKIAAALSMRISFEVCAAQSDYAAVKAIAKKPVGAKFTSIETFGSAYKDTSQNKYYLEMAEKRALSRAVLKLSDLSSVGAYGEDEADDFSRAKNPEPKAEPATQRPPVAAPAPEASAPATVPAAPSAPPAPSGEAPEMVALASEAQKKELVAMLANPLLDAEERTLLLTPPVDERSAKWVADTLVKLAALYEVRKDPKRALAAAQNQLRTAATKYATQMGEDQHKAWLLRASALTAKPEELRAEARQIMAYYQSAAA